MGGGDELGGFSRTVDQSRMVMYAGATWDWYRLHYDRAFAGELGLDGPLVDGQMLGAFLAEQILDHFGPAARIRTMSFRFRAMVFAGDTITVAGRITGHHPADDGQLLEVSQEIASSGKTCVTGTATVFLPAGS